MCVKGGEGKVHVVRKGKEGERGGGEAGESEKCEHTKWSHSTRSTFLPWGPEL